MKAIVGGKIYYNQKFVEHHCIVFDENIIAIDEIDDIDFRDINTVYNIGEHYLVPGFIDVHVHGFNGADTMDGSAESLVNIAQSLAAHGVTSFLPTTMTMPEEKIRKALQTIRNSGITQNSVSIQNPIDALDSHRMCNPKIGARILGTHLEGPFLNPKYSGAQASNHMKLPESDLLNEFKDIIKTVTIAPELEGALDLIQEFGERIRFSLGHSACDYDTAMQAFAMGACSTTHLFNAMTPLHHRNPGLSGAALCCDHVFVEVICDNIHIHPALYQLILRCKGTERIMLITDCIRAGGMNDGQYELGGQSVIVRDGKCTLEDGTIAGSVLTFGDALKNFVKYTQIPLENAVPMTSYNQAKYLGLEKKIGSIAVGMASDFVILDQDLNVVDTYICGKKIETGKTDISPETFNIQLNI